MTELETVVGVDQKLAKCGRCHVEFAYARVELVCRLLVFLDEDSGTTGVRRNDHLECAKCWWRKAQ